jgi:DUF4097 and DUF4098 domain-containing protein YvlB
MKTFLENLKKELKKRDFSERDIEEILEDHEEMIEAAQNDGLSDEELERKFGSPDKLAEDLLDSKSINEEPQGVSLTGYELLKSFPIIEKEFDINISVVSEDLTYLVHDEERIEIYYRDIKDIDNYLVKFDGKELRLEYKKTFNFSFRRSSGQLVIKVPKGIISKNVQIMTVSGDAKIEDIHSDSFHLKTTSGDISVNTFHAGKAKFTTVSGDFNFHNGTISSLDISMVSGDAKLEDIVVTGEIVSNTVSGDLELTKVESDSFILKSVSGDCIGVEFYPKTVTLKSVSGDIKINNTDVSREIHAKHKKTLSGTIKIN